MLIISILWPMIFTGHGTVRVITRPPWLTRIPISQVKNTHISVSIMVEYERMLTSKLEISEGLDLLWRNNIDPSKVLLGLGFYGRSFTLADASCNTPGCAFDTSAYSAGGAAPGECTRTSGILSDYEIARILDEYQPTTEYDETAGVNWIIWNSNQWYLCPYVPLTA